MSLLVFEDEYWSNFKPLSYTRPCFDLMRGGDLLVDKITRSVEHDGLYLFTRSYLACIEAERHPEAEVNKPPPSDEQVTLINGLIKSPESIARFLKRASGREFVVLNGERILAARLRASRLEEVSDSESLCKRLRGLLGVVEAFSVEETQLHNYPWEMLDVEVTLPSEEGSQTVGDGVAVKGSTRNIWLGEDVDVEPFTLLDARRGPIIIKRGTVVESGTRVVGPCVIGEDSVVYGGRIGPSVVTGPVCRLSGEVEHSIFLGFSNKRHLGFIGHSIIGEWVNIGAATCNSNLKNTYGEVRVYIEGVRTPTGRQFVGAFIGDHARTAIGTMINTGRKLGCFTMSMGRINIDLPPFTATTHEGSLYEIDVESEIRTAERMMSRRGKRLTENYKQLIREIYYLTAEERGALIAK